MEEHYKLHRVRELADGDEDFVIALLQAFLEEVPEDAKQLQIAVDCKDYLAAYKAAHKMKPTIDLFELGVFDDLIEVQDWGKFELKGKDVSQQLGIVLRAVENTTAEIKVDFNL
ncbi:MAG: Hpt domain-containing protein [Flavobacteriaceae bacterium]|nr:Hpt domain-containing protein [Flavobacteriaceae bacterium]